MKLSINTYIGRSQRMTFELKSDKGEKFKVNAYMDYRIRNGKKPVVKINGEELNLQLIRDEFTGAQYGVYEYSATYGKFRVHVDFNFVSETCWIEIRL